MSKLGKVLIDGLQDMSDSGKSLDKVAEYCENNYFASENKAAAFSETKDYVNQSLASVAYQIDVLAYNFIDVLAKESVKLDKMAADVKRINQE